MALKNEHFIIYVDLNKKLNKFKSMFKKINLIQKTQKYIRRIKSLMQFYKIYLWKNYNYQSLKLPIIFIY